MTQRLNNGMRGAGMMYDLPHEELEAYADTLDQIRQEARQHPRKNHF